MFQGLCTYLPVRLGGQNDNSGGGGVSEIVGEEVGQVEVGEMIDGKVRLDPVNCPGEWHAEHGRIQNQNVEREVPFLERDSKLPNTVQRGQVEFHHFGLGIRLSRCKNNYSSKILNKTEIFVEYSLHKKFAQKLPAKTAMHKCK